MTVHECCHQEGVEWGVVGLPVQGEVLVTLGQHDIERKKVQGQYVLPSSTFKHVSAWIERSIFISLYFS